MSGGKRSRKSKNNSKLLGMEEEVFKKAME